MNLQHGVATEVYEQRQALEPVRELLGRARIDTTQILRAHPAPATQARLSFYEERATKLLSE